MTQPSPTVPVCYRHPSRETYIRCTRCDRPICPDCMREAAVGHQCPECVAEGRRAQPAARTPFGGGRAGRAGYVTKTLIGINVAVFLVAILVGGLGSVAGGGWGGLLGGSTELHQWFGMLGQATYSRFDPTVHGVAAGEWYRLLTSAFLHYGLLHLAMNMWALWVIGRDLEAALGPLRFLGLYLLSGLGGSVAAYLFAAPNVPVAGASGAIFGLFAAVFVLLKRLRRDTSAILPVLVLNLVITFAVPNISIAGHLGGMVVGALVAVGLAYAPRNRRGMVQFAAVAVVTVLLIGLVLVRTAALTG